jgi:RNA polymerase sigma factor (sigma-70 family)
VSPDDFSLTTMQVRAAQDGDHEAMNELFRRYLPRVTRIVASRLGCRWKEVDIEDDVVQETFLDAFAALRDGQIVDDAAFCGWIARCVQNNVMDQARRSHADKRGGGNVARFADLAESYLANSMLEDDQGTPSQHAIAGETEERLERSLMRINPRYREVITLRAYCRMPFTDIAEAMGLRTPNTAIVMFRRAREELRRRLDHDGR